MTTFITTTMDLATWDAADTAFYLRAKLGRARAWGDFLSDCIRDRTDYFGLTLLPIAYLSDRCRRPVYQVTQVREFVELALQRAPAPRCARELHQILITMPVSDLHLLCARARRARRVRVAVGTAP